VVSCESESNASRPLTNNHSPLTKFEATVRERGILGRDDSWCLLSDAKSVTLQTLYRPRDSAIVKTRTTGAGEFRNPNIEIRNKFK
jgi:hypothetical protein